MPAPQLTSGTLSATWPASVEALALHGVFAPESLSSDGDYVEASFEIRVESLPTDGGGARLYWGLYNASNEPGSIRYRPEFNYGAGGNPYSLTTAHSRLMVAGCTPQEMISGPAGVPSGGQLAPNLEQLKALIDAADSTTEGHEAHSQRGMGSSQRLLMAWDYDGPGRPFKIGAGTRFTEFEWDAEGRLTKATRYNHTRYWASPEKLDEVIYTYDAFGRRTGRIHTHWPDTNAQPTTSTELYIYDGHDVVADFIDSNGDGQIDHRRYYWNEPSIDRKIGIVARSPGIAKHLSACRLV